MLHKLKKITYECSEPLCAYFIGHMANNDPDELGFLDKVHKDERTFELRFSEVEEGC